MCSNPSCRKQTIGPNSDVNKVINIGVASHITAASANGPRFEEEMNQLERKSINNGIWLCASCAALIDKDISVYTTDILLKWKTEAENEARLNLIQNAYKNISSRKQNKKNAEQKDLFCSQMEAEAIINEFLRNDEIPFTYTIHPFSVSVKTKTSFYEILNIECTVQFIKELYINRSYEELNLLTNAETWSLVNLDYGPCHVELLKNINQEWNNYWQHKEKNQINRYRDESWNDLIEYSEKMNSSDDIIYLAEELDMFVLYPIVIHSLIKTIDDEFIYSTYCEYDFDPTLTYAEIELNENMYYIIKE